MGRQVHSEDLVRRYLVVPAVAKSARQPRHDWTRSRIGPLPGDYTHPS